MEPIILKKGKVLIFNDSSREGSRNHVFQLKETFKVLNCDVHDHEISESKTVIAALEKDETLKNYDFLITMVMSHGGPDNRICINRINDKNKRNDKDNMQLQRTFLNPLTKIPHLNKKLKLCIAQMCRGATYSMEQGREQDGADDADGRDYCAIWFATSEDHVADREIFVKALCEELKTGAKEGIDLASIVLKVQKKMSPTQQRSSWAPNFSFERLFFLPFHENK